MFKISFTRILFSAGRLGTSLKSREKVGLKNLLLILLTDRFIRLKILVKVISYILYEGV